MQFYYDLTQLGINMQIPYDRIQACIVPNQYEVVGVVSNEFKSDIKVERKYENLNLNDVSQYCLCDYSSTSFCTDSESSCIASLNKSLNSTNSKNYCKPNTSISQIHNANIEGKLKNSTSFNYENLHMMNSNYAINENVSNYGDISQVITCKNNYCANNFEQCEEIALHNKVHMKVRPYPCRYCPRAYTQKGNLLKHMRKHTQPDINKRRLYKCEFCQRGYTEKYNLKTHQMRFHSREYRMMRTSSSNISYVQEELIQ